MSRDVKLAANLDDPDAVWGQSIREVTRRLVKERIRETNDAQRACIVVIGPVAAGKRTIAELICRAYGAALIDPDEAKKNIPEYRNGAGWHAVHAESTFLCAAVLERLIRDNSNLVLMRIGADVDDVREMIADFRALGYSTILVHMTIESDEAIRRMLRRFLNIGKFINPEYCKSIGDRPRTTYQVLRNEGVVDEAMNIDNNGPPGEFRLIDGEKTKLALALRKQM